MPISDESTLMPADALSKTLSIAVGSGSLKKVVNTPPAKDLLKEVSLDFARALNKELFDAEVGIFLY
jgi:hypothetical protein